MDDLLLKVYTRVQLLGRAFEAAHGPQWPDKIRSFASNLGFRLNVNRINVGENHFNLQVPDVGDLIVGFVFDRDGAHQVEKGGMILWSDGNTKAWKLYAPIWRRFWFPNGRVPELDISIPGNRYYVISIVILEFEHPDPPYVIPYDDRHEVLVGWFRDTFIVDPMGKIPDDIGRIQYPFIAAKLKLQRACSEYLKRQHHKQFGPAIRAIPNGRDFEDALIRHQSDDGSFII